MATFSELQIELAEKKFEKTILDRLVDYLDETFLVPDQSKKLILITDERIAVPEESIDEVITKLCTMSKALEEDINTILNTKLKE